MDQSRYTRQLRKARTHLASHCDALNSWMSEYGRCAIQVAWQRSPYEALVRAIAFQQLHGKAAQSILNRLIAACPKEDFPTPKSITSFSVEQMRAFGFSQAKVAAIHGIAQAAIDGRIPSRSEAEKLDDEELIERLIELRGVGRWTVEMLLMFTLGRMDVMPVDDYGVKAGVAHLFELPEMPKKAQMLELTEHWRPFRSIGAWYMWRLLEATRVK